MNADAHITPARVLELKQEARAMKGKHAAVLAQLAHREGFASWEVLVAKAGGSEAVHQAKREGRS
jgi:hypothetical protein